MCVWLFSITFCYVQDKGFWALISLMRMYQFFFLNLKITWLQYGSNICLWRKLNDCSWIHLLRTLLCGAGTDWVLTLHHCFWFSRLFQCGQMFNGNVPVFFFFIIIPNKPKVCQQKSPCVLKLKKKIKRVFNLLVLSLLLALKIGLQCMYGGFSCPL